MWLAQHIVARQRAPRSPKLCSPPPSTSILTPPLASKPSTPRSLCATHAPRFSGSTYSNGMLASLPPPSGSIRDGRRLNAYLRKVDSSSTRAITGQERG